MECTFIYLTRLCKTVCIFGVCCLCSLTLLAQQGSSFTGTVTAAADHTPLPGVTVIVKGGTNGTTTDVNGKYVIAANKGDTLVFNYVGFIEQYILAGSRRVINISLKSSSKQLADVVILGYGSQIKKDVTASVSTIDVSKLKDVPSANVTRLLEGQAPGVTVKQTTGSPGREFEVTIRGLGSLGAGSQPLYVIDGFPVGNSVGQNLNPEDIKTITILKDAVSTAIYGARGANGVVLITTKTAKT